VLNSKKISSSLIDMNLSHRFPIRIYWEDTDAGGIVYHANYLRYMERARSDWLRLVGFEQNRERTNPNGVLFVVASIDIQYHRPAVLDDELVVVTGIERLGRASVIFDQKVMRGEELIAQAKVRVGTLSAQTRYPCALPKSLYDQFNQSLALSAS
jgi:acyl-CoA thioester hydrolase